MNKRGASFIFWSMIILALAVGIAVQANEGFNLQSFKDNLAWEGVDLGGETDLINAVESLTNGMIDAYFHFAKWVAQLASENPQVPFQLLLYIVLFTIFLPFLIGIIKVVAIIFILIREWKQKRRDKKVGINEELIKQ